MIRPRDLAHLDEVVKRSAATHRVVLAVGGDGTLHRVLNAADLERRCWASTLGHRQRFRARTSACRASLQRPSRILGSVVTRSRPTTAWPTASAITTARASGWTAPRSTCAKQRKNVLTRNYNIAFLMALAGLDCPQLQIEFDGERARGKFYWSLAMNSPYIGGGTRIAPAGEHRRRPARHAARARDEQARDGAPDAGGASRGGTWTCRSSSIGKCGGWSAAAPSRCLTWRLDGELHLLRRARSAHRSPCRAGCSFLR